MALYIHLLYMLKKYLLIIVGILTLDLKIFKIKQYLSGLKALFNETPCKIAQIFP